MGSKKRRPNPETVEDWIRQGFGQGEGAEYKPFSYVRDVPSQGASHMVQSTLTGRVHHYLSDGEWSVHLLAEYCRATVDIREQYALLPWTEVRDVADAHGITYPRYPSTSTPFVLTTDLLMSLARVDGKQLVAVAVKTDDVLDDRTIEKLWLEKMYWRARGIAWVLVTRISRRAENLAFFQRALQVRQRSDSEDLMVLSVSAEFERHWTASVTFGQALEATATRFELAPNDAHLLLGRAVWAHQSRIDLDGRLIGFEQPFDLRA